jgi:glycosyltransferase involved in cell wall biosynthesis
MVASKVATDTEGGKRTALVEAPKILVVNPEPVHSRSATGLTMLSLLRDWPEGRLAQLYTHPTAPDLEFCRRSLRVGCSFQRPVRWGGRPVRGAEGRNGWLAGALVFSPRDHAGPGSARRLSERVGGRLRQFCCLGMIPLQESLRSWIGWFGPDIIYSMLYDLDIMTLVVEVAEHSGVPVIPHFMDDWPSTLSQHNLLYRLLDPWWKARLRRVMLRSPMALTISEAMAHEFGRRYGMQMVPFMRCVERELLSDKPGRNLPNGVTRFTYVGGLHLNRWKVLREVGLAMRDLADEGIRFEALIYAHPRRLESYRKHLTIPPVMKVVGSVSHEDVPRAQEDTDWLLHVESFEAWDRSFTRLSLSSKLPEYLAAGRPILAYGPAEVASMRYISELGCGLVVGEQDRDSLRNALRRAATSPELQQSLGKVALEAARMRHDGPRERQRFRQVVESVVAARRVGQ